MAHDQATYNGLNERAAAFYFKFPWAILGRQLNHLMDAITEDDSEMKQVEKIIALTDAPISACLDGEPWFAEQVLTQHAAVGFIRDYIRRKFGASIIVGVANSNYTEHDYGILGRRPFEMYVADVAPRGQENAAKLWDVVGKASDSELIIDFRLDSSAQFEVGHGSDSQWSGERREMTTRLAWELGFRCHYPVAIFLGTRLGSDCESIRNYYDEHLLRDEVGAVVTGS